MPRKAERLLEKMRRSPHGWKRTDLDSLYTGFGFIIISNGGHDKVTHPKYPQLITFLPRHNIAHYIVRQAVSIIDRLKVLEESAKQGDR